MSRRAAHRDGWPPAGGPPADLQHNLAGRAAAVDRLEGVGGAFQREALRSDLARNRSKKCVLAYWHHSPFSSGQSRGYTYYRAFWRALHQARADILLAGHDHVYERFARQSASGSASSTGPVQFMARRAARAAAEPVRAARTFSAPKVPTSFAVARATIG